MKNDMNWGILIHLGRNMWGDLKAQKKLSFDREVWNRVVEKCEQAGMNTIWLDLGEGIRYDSHPELAIEGSWTPAEMNAEVRRLKAKGIELIPKLNFSTLHDAWLGEYARMVSTPVYYQVCRELIQEVYEMFDHPEYMHIGMDEENWKHADDPGYSYIVIRRDGLLYHDANYLADCVKELGAKCIIWNSMFIMNGDVAFENIAQDVIVAGGTYYAYYKENWHKVSEQSDVVREFYATRFVRRHGYTIEYIEEDPVVPGETNSLIRCMELGRPFMVITSNLFTKINDEEAVRYFKENCLDPSLLQGFIECPWGKCVKENEGQLLEAIDLLMEAKKRFWD